jgi:hypothetical protein
MRTTLVVIATLLSLFNGWLSVLSVLVFSSHESSILWASIYLPITLWLISLACLKFPRTGATVFTLMWIACVVLCFDPMHHSIHEVGWEQCADNLRFSLLGGILLLINAAIPKQGAEATARK